ncbi:hypothetical protein MJO28_015832 [Puccinia striiformis f. sp. tritici]|uniref:Uncharacterized protein n=1 Tax=Puccinia striiformis f. sp. tritici TaxID=168172 RepID=A0ACC0DQ11_9BASI|nr:hypothetical protein MJO28_015832 [Puccinia striiformis f. sp. tritici]
MSPQLGPGPIDDSKAQKPTELSQPYHPLDPLSAVEINSACSITKEYLYQNLKLGQVVITYVNLIDPKKEDVLRFLGILTKSTQQSGGTRLTRECEVCAIEVGTGSTYLTEVRLCSSEVSKSPTKLANGTHSCISIEEVDLAEKIAKNDARVIELCKHVGISKKQIFADGWAMGFDSRFGNFKRLQQCLMYARLVEHGNLYAHPLDMVVIVDVLAQKVVHVDFPAHRIPGPQLSSGTTLPPPKQTTDKEINDQDIRVALQHSGRDRIHPPLQKFDYLPHLLNLNSLERNHEPWKMRDDLKPLHVVQPEGVSFTMEGNVLKWQKWQMHIGYNYREGLVINTITYTDKGRVRPLFYRLSLAEMVVPYAAPESPHHRKYGLGNLANSLSLGCDCLGTIQYLDVVNVSLEGQAVVIKNGICIHEEDAGLLWKHSDLRPGGMAHSVRSRKLVVSMICTVANYEYMLYWNFFQDGTISFDVKLSGILNIYLLAEGESTDGFGTKIASGLVAQHHAHTFCLRIDPMIDGLKNSVVQTDIIGLSESTGSPENYLGNGFKVLVLSLGFHCGFYNGHNLTIVFLDTSEGTQTHQRRSPEIRPFERKVLVDNQSSWNKLHYASQEPIGYRIVCRDQPPMIAKPDSMIAKRAPFAKHDFFVTPYVRHQFYPAGKFVPGGIDTPADSIENWLAVDQSIDNTDIVTYLTFGVNHIPTPEQFPVMSAETLTVTLKPSGFFDQNPSLDVPNAQDSRSRSINMPTGTSANHLDGHCCKELSNIQTGNQKLVGEPHL